ncbi:MAG: 2,3-bisphosphoglycerate-independent phosphoglycerate mutase [Alphaproteobacteria bacterium]|jgi:2,3-bisphosphoglycerate-independent phosphoglycerate mutase
MSKSLKNTGPVVLCILDGWGERRERADNAIAHANTPVWDDLNATCPHAQLEASESHVGLPRGQMGNSEVGHTNIGAGRIVKQDLPRIDEALADGSLAKNSALIKFIDTLKASGGAAHLLGLMSPGGVHSHQDHIAALANILADAGVTVIVHAFLDGRDTPPSSALEYLKTFEAAAPRARIGTITGRYFALDRDNRWDRVVQAYDLIMSGDGEIATSAVDAIEAAYKNGKTDEFAPPATIGGYAGMNDGDGLFMANFRADRAREILGAFVDPGFDGFERSKTVNFAASLGMTSYSDALDAYFDTLFPSIELTNVIGAIIAESGFKQLRIAETEKYAHVTFFFNGGVETEFEGETRILVPSPDVATYDLKPEMSAPLVTDKLVAALNSGAYDFLVVNYANTDMVGHTGDLSAATHAVEAVDACLGQLCDAVATADGVMIVTADHGNAEMMRDPNTGQVHTAHTLNKVPVILFNRKASAAILSDGALSDIAPTLLSLLGVDKPTEMTGRSLISPIEGSRAAE